MSSIFNPPFAHRLNRDGSYDSICKMCFRTIASGVKECDLAAGEQRHKCNGPPSPFLIPSDAMLAQKAPH